MLVAHYHQSADQEPTAKGRKGDGRGEEEEKEKSSSAAPRHKAQGYAGAGAVIVSCSLPHSLVLGDICDQQVSNNYQES